MENLELKDILINKFLSQYPAEAADILNSVSDKHALEYLQAYPPEVAREIILKLNGDHAASVLSIMSDSFFVRLYSEIDSYSGAILISRIPKEIALKKVALLPSKLSKEISDLLTYPAESAGFLMDTRIMTFSPENTVEEALSKLRKHKERRINNLYIVDKDHRLIGRVLLQMIALTSPEVYLKDLMEDCSSVHVMSPQDEVVALLKDGKLISLPVVDLDNKLLGVIRYDALVKAAQQDAADDALTIFGAGREERALSKVSYAVKKRLPWLEINLATAFLAAAVVGLFEDTIARITVLAVFLPVVAGQSGNTGSQALAVTIRGLALREIRVSQWLRVARKEAAVGFINGVAVSLSTAIIVYFWASSMGLAVVIGVSMIISMVIAGFSGAVIPILLKSVGQDPAQSSSIVLTTVTDIVGFMSFLGLATVLGTILGIV